MDTTITSTEVRVDLRTHPRLAVLKTVASVSARYIAEIAQYDEATLGVTLQPRTDKQPPADLRADFLALLADIALQGQIAEQTKDIRSALVRAAFFEALGASK